MEKSTRAKINMAFRRLRKAGYFAEQDFWCCNTCAGADMSDEELKKFVFYHNQDAESLKGTKLVRDMYVSWEGDGAEIVKIFEDCGLAVMWNGDPNIRIMICRDKE